MIMMRRLPLSAGCLVIVLIVLCDLDQSTGDSESYGQVSISSCSSKPEPPNGLVTIKLSSGSAHHVCLNGFNRGAAAAVCRQLGYLDADSVPKSDGEYVFYGPPDLYDCPDESHSDPPKEVISQVLCPIVSNYSLYGELHVMRCSVGDPVPRNTCEHTTALRCRSKVLPNNGYSYNGRVDLDSSNQGLVTINLHGAANLVCLDNIETMDKDGEAIGSSVCRQMGFTNGTGISVSNRDGHSTYKFSSLYCNSETGSYQCFSHCINQTEVTSPVDCQQVLSVTCSYNPSLAELMTSGSTCVCSLQDTSPYFISTIVLGAVSGAEFILICLICTVCLITCLQRRGCCHRPPPPNDRPNAGEHQVLFNNGYQRDN